jgi:hypothetical protein
MFNYSMKLRMWHRVTFSIKSGYRLEDGGVRVQVPVVSRIFASPYRPDRLWGLPKLLFNGYWGLFPLGLSSQGLKLTAHLQLVLKPRKCGSIYQIPHRLHDVVRNYLSTGTILPFSLPVELWIMIGEIHCMVSVQQFMGQGESNVVAKLQ